jgi:hypothetical protein
MRRIAYRQTPIQGEVARSPSEIRRATSPLALAMIGRQGEEVPAGEMGANPPDRRPVSGLVSPPQAGDLSRDDPAAVSTSPVPPCAHLRTRGPSPAMEEDADFRRICLDCGRRIQA